MPPELDKTNNLPAPTGHNGGPPLGAAAAVSITAGLVNRPQLAAQFGKSERTVIRWEHAGLPVIKLGMTRLYDPMKAREWLLTHERRHDVPKRGRPVTNKRAA